MISYVLIRQHGHKHDEILYVGTDDMAVKSIFLSEPDKESIILQTWSGGKMIEKQEWIGGEWKITFDLQIQLKDAIALAKENLIRMYTQLRQIERDKNDKQH